MESASLHEIDDSLHPHGHGEEQEEQDHKNQSNNPPPLSQVSKATVEVVPPRVVDSNSYLMERAHELLSRVQQATRRSSSVPAAAVGSSESLKSGERVTITTTEGHSEEIHWKRRQHETLDIDWLLRGVPEVYEDPGIVSDDLVEQLVSAGGLPPSQLEYPILYSATQAVLSRLRDVQQLHLQFLDLFIFGARCGLRKDGSFLVVRPPPGCFDRNHERYPVTIDLPAPQELYSPKHKNVLKHYHVGTVPMDQQSISWNVKLTDSLIKDWLNFSAATGLNCIQMELYSYLTPRPRKLSSGNETAKARLGVGAAAKATTRRNSSLLIGSVNIPLSGLFSSPQLLINVSSSILLDPASHSLIADRFQRMPIGVKLKPLPHDNNSAGFVKCQLSLRNEFGQLMSSNSSSGADFADSLNTESGAGLNSIATFHGDESQINLKQFHSHLDDALQFLPSELPLLSTSSSLPSRRCFLCVAIHHLTFSNFESFLAQFGIPMSHRGDSQIKIRCVYKIALSSSRFSLAFLLISLSLLLSLSVSV
jgi:hypothetical protein